MERAGLWMKKKQINKVKSKWKKGGRKGRRKTNGIDKEKKRNIHKQESS